MNETIDPMDSASDDVGPGWFGAQWQVEIFAGRPLETDSAPAPMKFGTPQMFLGGENTDLSIPLVYGPVFLRGDGNQLRIQVPVEMTREEHDRRLTEHGSVSIGYNDVRVMAKASFEFDWSGELRCEGFEIGDDNSLTFAVWSIEAYRPEPSDGAV